MTQASRACVRDGRETEWVITQEIHCRSSCHVSSEPAVRYCPNCGELVNEKIPFKQCTEQSHARMRMDVGQFCRDCGEKL